MLWLILLAQTLTIGSGGGSMIVGGSGGDVLGDPYFDRIPLYYTAGRVNPSVVDCDGCRWQFWDGTYLEATSFDSTFASDGVVYLETNLDKSTLQFLDNNTDAQFVLDLEVFRRLTYYLSLYNCANITGDLSDVSGLTNYLNLYNCANITGDLSDVSGLTYYLNLANCANITGDLSDVSGLTNYLNLYHCTNVTGDLSDVSGLTYYLRLSYCPNVTGILTPHPSLSLVYLTDTDTSASDISQSLVNLEAVTTATGTRVFSASHIKRSELTAAGETAAAALFTAGWALTFKAE